MTEGVDYSFDPASALCLKRAGKHFAVRYVGTPSSGKTLTRAEASILRTAGVDLVSVYQTTTGFMTEGASGATAASRAHAHAVDCGMPPDRPIYFALDMDPAAVTGAGWLSVERFLADAAGVLGRHRTGVYGGIDAIRRLVDTPGQAKHCRYGWQTYAWSRGLVSSAAHLLQYRNGVKLCDGTLDLCRSLADDFGQWSYNVAPHHGGLDMSKLVVIPKPGTTRVDVLAIGTDNAVWHYWSDTFAGLAEVMSPEHGEWLGGDAKSVDGVWSSESHFGVIAHGRHNDSWCREWRGDHWSDWYEAPRNVRLAVD